MSHAEGTGGGSRARRPGALCEGSGVCVLIERQRNASVSRPIARCMCYVELGDGVHACCVPGPTRDRALGS